VTLGVDFLGTGESEGKTGNEGRRSKGFKEIKGNYRFKIFRKHKDQELSEKKVTGNSGGFIQGLQHFKLHAAETTP